MAQQWNDLLFAHWPIPEAELRAVVPAALPIDTFDGYAWIGVVPFHMSGVRLRWLPELSSVSAFPELNVRTYTTLDGKPGVYFFSLDAANHLAVAGARLSFRLPYFYAEMSVRTGEVIEYESRRADRSSPPARFAGRYRPRGEVFRSEPGSLAYWLTERYCLYTGDRRGRVYRAEILHDQWPLQPAEADIVRNTMTRPVGIELPDTKPVLHFSERVNVVVWPPRRIR